MLVPRVRSRTVELLAKGTRYSFRNLTSGEARYTEDTVLHLVRYFWSTILSLYRSNEDMCVIHCDLLAAAQALPPLERQAISLMMQGYELRDVEDGIGPRMDVAPEVAAKILKRAYRLMAQFLGDGK